MFGNTFPFWLPPLAALGFHPVAVYLRSSLYVHAVEALLPPDSYVRVLDASSRLDPELVAPGLAVGFSDFRLRPFELRHCEALALKWLLSSWGPSGRSNHWTSISVEVSHSQAGGVTDLRTRIHRWTLRHLPHLPALPVATRIPRDASTIISAATFAKGTRPCPQQRRAFPLQAVNLGSPSAPIWHSGGLLPGRPTRRTRVLTPCLGLPPAVWGIRRLTQAELLHALDFNDGTVSALEATQLVFAPDFWNFALPGKCLIAGFEALCAPRGLVPARGLAGLVSNEGGRVHRPQVEGKVQIGEGKVPEREGGVPVRKVQNSQNNKRLRLAVPAGAVSAPPQRVAAGDVSASQTSMMKPQPQANSKYASLFATTHGVKAPADEYTAWFLKEKLSSLTLGQSDEAKEQGRIETTDPANLLQIERDARESKATKSDNAAVPEYLWLEHLIEDAPKSMAFDEWSIERRAALPKALTVLRKFGLRRWRRNVTSSFRKWMRAKKNEDAPRRTCVVLLDGARFRWSRQGRQEYEKWYQDTWPPVRSSQQVARDALSRAMGSTWWAWDEGSTPFFWRWPAEYEGRIQDGVPVHFKKQPPLNRQPQRDAPNAKTRNLMIEKLRLVRKRKYIIAGLVESLTNFFSVDKGPIDIRMVYDGSASGLNDAMWVPGFGLPTIDTHLRAVGPTTFMGDIDIGEMFLNFPLHESIQPYAGVDFTKYFGKSEGTVLWERWCRCAMGLTSSPYLACQGMGFAEEVIRGDRHDPKNVFRWKIVRLNLPGQPDYDPSLPWVAKMRNVEGNELAADFFIFVDDVRPCGPTKAEAWQAARRAASTIN